MQEPAQSPAAASPRNQRAKSARRTALLGAMLLMATSATGPGFITVFLAVLSFGPDIELMTGA